LGCILGDFFTNLSGRPAVGLFVEKRRPEFCFDMRPDGFDSGAGLPDDKPKIQIWVIFGGSYNRRCWYIL
jgi:hypothetical protein